MTNQSISSPNEKVSQLFSSRRNELIRFGEVKRLLGGLTELNSSFSPSDLNELVRNAADQHGRWSAEWGFSTVSDPNTEAGEQMQGWSNIWNELSNALVEVTPQSRDSITKVRKLYDLKYVLQKSVEQTKHNPFATFVNTTLHKLAVVLNQFGLDAFAHSVERLALYPRNSVGREL